MSDDIYRVGIRVDTSDVNRANQSLDSLNTHATRASRATRSVTASTKEMAQAMSVARSFAAGLTGGLSAVGLTGFVRSLLDTTKEIQSVNIRLQSLTKSSKDYADVQSFLSDTSNRLHKDNLLIADSFSKILVIEQAGLITRKQSKELLEGFANAAAQTGASNAQLQQSMYGLNQALGSGTVHMEELNQVTEPVPGLMIKLANSAGVTVGEFRELIKEGKITSELFGRIITDAFKSYQGAAEKAAGTLESKYTDVSNAWTNLVRAIEKPIVNTLTPILDTLTKIIKVATEFNSKGATPTAFGFTTPSLDSWLGVNRSRGATGSWEPANTGGATGSWGEEVKKTTALQEEVKKLSSAHDGAARSGVAHHARVSKAVDSTLSTYRSMLESLERQAALYGDNSEVAAVLFETQYGSLRKINQALKDNLVAHAREIDLLKEKEDLAREADEVIAEGNRLAAKQRADQQQELDRLTQSFNGPLEDFKKKLADIQDAKILGIIDDKRAKKELDLASEGYNDLLERGTSTMDRLTEYGVQAAHSIQNSFADFLFDPFKNGTEGMLTTFRQILAQMASELITSQITKAAKGFDWGGLASSIVGVFGGGISAAAGSSAGGIVSSSSGFGGNIGGQISAFLRHDGGDVDHTGVRRTVPAGIFAKAPRYHDGLQPGEFPAILQEGERVLSRAQVARESGTLKRGNWTNNITVNVSAPNGKIEPSSLVQLQNGISRALQKSSNRNN